MSAPKRHFTHHHRHWLWHWSRRLTFALLLVILLIAALVAALQYSPRLRNALQAKIIDTALTELKPRLPFTIERIDVQETWTEFFHGRVSSLSFQLKWGDWRIFLSGSLTAKRNSARHEIDFDYSPSVTLEPAEVKKGDTLRSPVIPLTLSARIEYEFTHFSKLDELEVDSAMKKFAWKALHLSLEQPELNLYWAAQGKSGNLVINLDAAQVAYENTKPDRDVHVTGVHFHGESEVGLRPFHYGPKLGFKLTAQSSEVLWGERYFSAPLNRLPFEAYLLAPAAPADPWQAKLTMGVAGKEIFKLDGQIGLKDHHITANWSSAKLPIHELLTTLTAATQSDSEGLAPFFARFDGIDIKRGTLSTSGHIRYSPHALPDIQLQTAIDHLSFEWPDYYLAVGDVHLALPLSNSQATEGTLSIDQILYRKVIARLKPTRIQLSPQDHTRLHFNFYLGAGGSRGSGGSGKTLPIEVKQFPLAIGSVQGQIHLPDASEKDFHYELTSSAHLAKYAIERVIPPLCLKIGRLPPATVQLDFPTIDIDPDSVEPQGELSASLFGGTIKIDNLGFYDLKSPVRETDFDLDVDGLRLDQLGDYLGFGEMDGFLHAYAHDVTLQNALPTHYDFKLELLHDHASEVIFSPEAMQNLLPLVGADGILKMGGFGGSFARWLGFGLPRRLLGGYNVLFAGISLFSDEGNILLETLDPPLDMDPTRRAAYLKLHANDHYILYGVDWVLGIPTFKIQLQTKGYPVILDATSISNYVYRQLEHFNRLGDERAKKLAALAPKKPAVNPGANPGVTKEKENEKEIRVDLNCDPPHLSSAP